MATVVKNAQTQILGATIMELLSGELSDETIAAVDSLKREDVPEPLNNLVGMIHGMSTMPELRQSIVGMLLDEVRIAAIEVLEEKYWEPGDRRSTAWGSAHMMLTDMMQDSDSDPNIVVHDGVNKELLPDPEQAPVWTAPLIAHAQGSRAEGKELTLELLDVLETIIKKRREQLS